MTETGTEKRVDELSKRVDEGLQRVDVDIRGLRSEIKAVRVDMKSGFETMDAKIDGRFDGLAAQFNSLQRTMIVMLGGALGTIAAGVIAALLTARL